MRVFAGLLNWLGIHAPVASRIFSAYLVSGHVTEANGDNMLERSVAEALKMAKCVEEAVQADQELG